jgi:hypothetical protein
MKLIHDITPARNDWERHYARMEYMRIAYHDLWNPTTYIPVTTNDHIFTCMTCGALNTFWVHLCENCDARAQVEEGNYRG